MVRADPPRVLLIRLAGMGDVLLATPVIRALRQAWPDSRLTFLVEQRFREVVVGNPDLDQVIPLWVPGWLRQHRGLTVRALRKAGSIPPAMARLVGRRFEVVIDLDSTLLSWLCSMAVVAPEKVLTWYYKVPRALARRYSHLVTPRQGEHAIDFQMRALDPLGLPRPRPELVLVPTAQERERAGALVPWSSLPRTVIAVHPGASVALKCWPLDRYQQLCRELCHKHDLGILVVGGAEEREQAQCLVDARPDRIVSVAGRTTIREAAAVLARCSLFVGNDSGPMHIAESQRVPVLCLMGPTAAFWKGPYGRPHQVIDATLVCPNIGAAPFGPRRRCQCGHCLEQLPAGVVTEHALAMLSR